MDKLRFLPIVPTCSPLELHLMRICFVGFDGKVFFGKFINYPNNRANCYKFKVQIKC